MRPVGPVITFPPVSLHRCSACSLAHCDAMWDSALAAQTLSPPGSGTGRELRGGKCKPTPGMRVYCRPDDSLWERFRVIGLLPSSWLVSSDNDNDRSRATTSGAGRRDVRQQRQCVRQPRGDGQAAVTLCPPPCQRGHAIHAPAERAPTQPVEEAGRSRPATPSRLTGLPVPPLQPMLRDEPGPELHVLPGSSRLPSPTGTLDHTLDSKESISAPNLYGAFIEKSEPVPLPRKQLLGQTTRGRLAAPTLLQPGRVLMTRPCSPASWHRLEEGVPAFNRERQVASAGPKVQRDL